MQNGHWSLIYLKSREVAAHSFGSLLVGADAEMTQLPGFHCPILTPRESLSVLDFCRFGDGAVLRRQLGQSRGSANTLTI